MRTTLLISGVLTLLVMWGLLPWLAPPAFYVHMTMHMGIVALAAPLIAIGISGGLFDPVIKYGWLFAPIPISLLELTVVWAWHAPGLHQFARHNILGLIAEQGMFLGCSILLWLSAFGGRWPQDANRTAAGIVGLLLTMMHMVLLGSLLALTLRTLYNHSASHGMSHEISRGVSESLSHGIGNGESHVGLTALEDQHLGGAIMLIGGGISYLMGGLWLSMRLLQENAMRARGSQ